jgi:hypothetical protein
MGGFNTLLALGAVVLGLAGLDRCANAEQMNGQLDIENHVGVQGYNDVLLRNYNHSGVSDGYDAWDASFNDNFPSGTASIYSDISAFDSSNPKLSKDCRLPSTSHDVFDIELLYNGALPSSYANYLFLSFPTGDIFGNENIILQQTDSSGNPIGSSYDVRSIIAGTLGDSSLNPSPGTFYLANIAAGSYNASNPYAHYSITINNAVPEPSTLCLLAIVGIAGAGAGGYRRFGNRAVSRQQPSP